MFKMKDLRVVIQILEMWIVRADLKAFGRQSYEEYAEEIFERRNDDGLCQLAQS